MDKRYIAIAVSLVALASGGAWLWARAPLTPMQAATVQRDASALGRSDIDDLSGVADLVSKADALPAGGAARAPTIVGLPPADTPLVESFTMLDAEARRGNATAACRLGAELARCKRVRTLQTMMINEEQENRSFQSLRDEEAIAKRVDELAERNELLERASLMCADTEQLPGQELARYFAIAARQGHVPSMIEYLSAGHMTAGAMVREPGLITEFRRDAPGMLTQALASADERLLQTLVNAAYIPDHTPLSSIMPEEWRSSGFITALLQQFPADVLKTRLPHIQINTRIPVSASERETAAKVYADYFAGMTARPAPDDKPADRLDWIRKSLSVERYGCEDPAAFQP